MQPKQSEIQCNRYLTTEQDQELQQMYQQMHQQIHQQMHHQPIA